MKEGQEGAAKPLEVSPLLLHLPQDRDTRNRLRKMGGCGGKVCLWAGGREKKEREPLVSPSGLWHQLPCLRLSEG